MSLRLQMMPFTLASSLEGTDKSPHNASRKLALVSPIYWQVTGSCVSLKKK